MFQFIDACREGKTEVVEEFIDNRSQTGLDTNGKDMLWQTALIVASWNDQVEIVKLLLACDEIQVGLADFSDDQAIHHSAERGYTEITELLLDKGADVNARGDEDKTPVLKAARSGNISCLELLLNRGARVDDTGTNGWTSLMWAAVNNKVSHINLLLDRGADINMKDKRGQTPLYMTAWLGHLSVAELLLRRGAEVEWEGENSPILAARRFCKHDVKNLLEDYRENPHKYRGKLWF